MPRHVKTGEGGKKRKREKYFITKVNLHTYLHAVTTCTTTQINKNQEQTKHQVITLPTTSETNERTKTAFFDLN